MAALPPVTHARESHPLVIFSQPLEFRLQSSTELTKCALCFNQLETGENVYEDSQHLYALHEKCATSTPAYQAALRFFQNLPAMIPEGDGRNLALSGFGNEYKIGEVDTGDEKDDPEQEGVPPALNDVHENPARIGEAENSDQPGAPPVLQAAPEEVRVVTLAGNVRRFLSRHKYTIFIAAVVAGYIGFEYLRRSTTENHLYCIRPAADEESLYCCAKTIFDSALNQVYYRYREHSIWQSAGEPPLNYHELPNHFGESKILASWTVNLAQRLWARVFG